MKKTTKRLLMSIVLMQSFVAFSQDVHFSQIFETPLLRNPSLAGIFKGDIRFQSVYRTQWNSVTTPYQTTSVSGEFKKQIGSHYDYITIGGQIVYDKAGTVALTTTQILPVINYQKSLSEFRNMYLSLGFMGGLIQRKLDRNKMTTNSQYDGTAFNGSLADGETFSSPNYSYFDASVGMSFNAQLGENEDDNIYIGAAYHHFNKAKKISFYRVSEEEMTPKMVGSVGLRMGMTSSSFFTLQADYTTQNKYKEIVGGVLYSIKLDSDEDPKYIFHTGAYFRWKDAIIPVAKLEFQPLSVAVSYDANISQLKQSSKGQGGFEISLVYQKAKKDNSSLDAVRCPKF